MNRRSFLSLLAGAGAATATSYFLPPLGGWKSDVIAQADPWSERQLIGTVDTISLSGICYCYMTSTKGAYLGINRETFYAKDAGLPIDELRNMYPTLRLHWDGERKRLFES